MRAELRVPDGRGRSAARSGAWTACESVDVELEDHYTGDEINATVNAAASFADAFPGETRGELDALRALFQRKALLARQWRLLRGAGGAAG